MEIVYNKIVKVNFKLPTACTKSLYIFEGIDDL